MSQPDNNAGRAFNVLPIPVFVVNQNGKLVDVNNAAVQFSGSKGKVELLQRYFLDTVVADEDKAETQVWLKEILEGHEDGKIMEVASVTPTGRKQVSLRAATAREGGKLSGAVIAAQDMGEIKSLAGTAGSGGAEHLSGALSACGLALFCTDNEGKIVEWTPKLAKLTGYTGTQARGQEATFCVDESFQRSIKKALDQALRGLDVARFSVEISHSSGKRKEGWLSVAPWRSATGSIVGAVGSIEDAAEVERKLGEADWIRTAGAEQLDRANALIFSVDSNSCITEWNHLLADVSGKEKEAVVGTKLADLVGAESKAVAEEAASAALAGDLAPPVQIALQPGLELTVGFSPQFSFDNKVIGALAVGQLVSGTGTGTAQSSAPGPSGRMKATVLHELRSPLHGVLGLANTLSQDSGPLKKPLSMIGLSAERVLDLVTGMMDFWNFSEQEARPAEMRNEVVDLSVLAKESLVKCASFKDKRGKPLMKDKVSLKSNIQSVTISGDAYGLMQLLNHLLMNALKFTTEGEVNLTVVEQRETRSALLTVADTGIGIKPGTAASRLFEAFQVVDATESRKYDGIGIGLAIVREVVRIHHGRCEMMPAEGKGTVVKVTLPLEPPSSTRAENGQAEAAKIQHTDTLAKEHIKVPLPGTKPRGPPSSWLGPSAQLCIQAISRQSLPVNGGSQTASSLPALKEFPAFQEGAQIGQSYQDDAAPNLVMSVDDDFVNQEVMRSILEPCGYEVVVCMSGAECLEYLGGDNPRPRLLLLDLMMPGLSGFDVLQALQKKFQHGELPVVMVSAKNQSSSVVKGYELGCTDWIHKPFCRQELIARVQSHLKMRDALLSYKRATCHFISPSQDHIPAVTAEDDSPGQPPAQQETELELQQEASDLEQKFIAKGPVDTTALYASIVCKAPDDMLAPVFEEWELLGQKHSAIRTEILGSCYVAVAMNTGDDSRHADRMLRMAQNMLDTGAKASMLVSIGLHTDSSIPAVVLGKEKSSRQYPKSSFFSDTVKQASFFCNEAAENRILLSRTARCRLSADVEDELQRRGLQLLAGTVESSIGEYYYVAGVSETSPRPLKTPLPQTLPIQEDVKAERAEKAQELERSQMELRRLQEELVRTRSSTTLAQQRLLVAEDQVLQARNEAASLKLQLQQAQPAQQYPGWTSSIELQPETKPLETPNGSAGSAGSASLLFLQWQNAHLQAEIRHYQQALTNAKSELQMHVLAGQLLESKHQLLQARVEHLELDLGFKAACGNLAQIEEVFAELPSIAGMGSKVPPSEPPLSSVRSDPRFGQLGANMSDTMPAAGGLGPCGAGHPLPSQIGFAGLGQLPSGFNFGVGGNGAFGAPSSPSFLASSWSRLG